MKVWAVSNQKGGVGKTTTVVSLGGLLAERGYRVLLVDLDPHGSLTGYFKMNPDDIQGSVYDLFQDALARRKLELDRYVRPSGVEGLSILPASSALSTIERQNGAGGLGLVMGNALAGVRGQYDFALIDSPPMLGVLMVNALAASEHLFVPVLCEFLALKGLERMLHTLAMIGKSRRVALRFTIVPTMFDRRTRAALQTLEVIRQRFGDQSWRSEIPVDTRIREASQTGQPVSRFAPGTKAAAAYAELLEDALSGGLTPRPEARVHG
ncbi:chromosome partitioning protein [Methylomagnum ishizawai]|uniref:Chromosome partitioning protein n=1 Tax=Methylomagnum ishizawai TaxID=1760988 RepID=A0A1Y6CX97_9GAMM|nr:ParA family protein [Methylomagnum ishizawai]SMF94967.1 chromosome partitioning protein [Methylomagnum ishizawai]